MEYAKDVLLNVNCRQAKKENKKFLKLITSVKEHKIITTIFCITTIMITLDCVLIGSFIEILNKV